MRSTPAAAREQACGFRQCGLAGNRRHLAAFLAKDVSDLHVRRPSLEDVYLRVVEGT